MNHKCQLRLRSELSWLILFVASKWCKFNENPGPQMRLHRSQQDPDPNKSNNMWIKAQWTCPLHKLPLPKMWNYTQHQNLYGHHHLTSSGFLIRRCKTNPNMVGCPESNCSIHGMFITFIHVFAPRHIYSFPVFPPPLPLASSLH